MGSRRKKKDIHDLTWVEEFPAREMDPEKFSGKTFRETVKEYASQFMDAKTIADALLLQYADFEKRCLAVFGMKASDVCKFYRTNADADVRKALWMLTLTGNTTATKIYSEYISEVAKEKSEQRGGINVVVNVRKDDEDEE